MENRFEPGAVTRAAKKRIEQSRAPIVFLDSVRCDTDVTLLHSFPHHALVYVTASPEVRFARTKLRKEKASDQHATFEQFLAEEKIATEIHIPRIGSTANFTIHNNGALEDYQKEVRLFATRFSLINFPTLSF